MSKLVLGEERHAIADQVIALLTDEKSVEKIAIIAQFLDMAKTNSLSEKRKDDEDWFEGMSSCLVVSHCFDESWRH